VPLNNTSTTSDNGNTETTDSIATLPAPLIYKNGETIVADTDTDAADHEAEVALLGSRTNKDTSETNATKNLATHENTSSTINEPLLSANYHRFTNELTAKIKKSIWKAVPDTQDSSTNKNVKNKKSDEAIIESTVNSNSPKNSTNTQDDSKNNAPNTTEALNTPRKEGLFAKHMKKAKAEPVHPLPKYAVLSVIDEGTGIPEDKREEVFSPFVRLQQKNKGSGLGLSLVSQIVTAHQGRILTDTLNGHTRFLVIIPVKHDPNYQQND